MKTVFIESKKKQKFRQTICLTFVFLCLSYFAYHAVSGQRGLLALISFSHQLEEGHQTLDSIRAERLKLEHHVTLLRPDSLDLDLLDEQAHKVLGYAKPTEYVYFLESEDAGFILMP